MPARSPVDGKSYAIGFEMRLPTAWNGRFWHQGNGGIDGSVVTALGNSGGGGPLTSALLQGFAVLSSERRAQTTRPSAGPRSAWIRRRGSTTAIRPWAR